MSRDKVAVCVISTNDRYIYKAIITLLSVREKNEENKNFEYFVCGNISDKYKRVIEEYNLGVLKIDLENIFVDSKGFIWPNECFWSCAIPEAFYKKGFSYSIVLDGDIFCIGKVPMNVIEEVEELALKKVHRAKNIEYTKLLKTLGMKEEDLEEFWMNSGVVVYNNKNLAKKKFKEKFINLYKDLLNVAYFETDEIVFFFLRIKGLFSFYRLGVEWNNFFKGNLPENKIIFLHFVRNKPWLYRFLWRKEVVNTPGCVGIKEYRKRQIKYKRLYIDFCKKIYGHKFYWYYIGDLIPVNFILKALRIRINKYGFNTFFIKKKKLEKINE